MPGRKITSRSTGKIPAYVEVYNMLYSEIVTQVYPSGSLLPSENALAENYGVSRNTIRLALAILTEDGLIVKGQGRGTEVTYKGDSENGDGQRMSNPLIRCAKNEIDMIDISWNYGPPTDIAQGRLGIKRTEIIMASNNVYFSGNKPVGHAFIQIPVRHIRDLDVSLDSEVEVSNLINKTIFEMSETARMTVRLVHAEGNITSYLKIRSGELVLYIETVLFNTIGEGLARCKFYFLPDEYELSFLI